MSNNNKNATAPELKKIREQVPNYSYLSICCMFRGLISWGGQSDGAQDQFVHGAPQFPCNLTLSKVPVKNYRRSQAATEYKFQIQ